MHTPTQNQKRGPGRPRKTVSEIKSCPVSLNLTEGQYDHFSDIAIKLGRPLGPTIVALALKGKVVAPLNKEEMDVLRKANGMCNNLNQLAKAAYQVDMIEIEDEIKTTLETLNMALLKIRKQS